MNAMSSLDPITATLVRITADFLELQEDALSLDAYFDELGADSMDMVELQALVEEAFGIVMDAQIRHFEKLKDFDRQLRDALGAKA